MTARHQLRSSTLAPAQRFSLRSVLRPPLRLLLAAIWLAAPIPAVRLLVCENGADPTAAVEATVEDGAAGAAISRVLIAALGWAPDVEPQLHRHDGRRLAEPVAATQLQEGGSFSLSLSVSVSLCVYVCVCVCALPEPLGRGSVCLRAELRRRLHALLPLDPC